LNLLRLAVVSCGFLGLSPVAPGTVGTLAGVLIVWGLARLELFALWMLVVCALLYVVGRSLGEWAESRARGKDPGFFVLDEVLGYLVTLLWVRGPSLFAMAFGFAVFRFFDIVKPPPVRRFERIRGGDGILLDDVVAGLYGLGVMSLARLAFGDASLWIHGGSAAGG